MRFHVVALPHTQTTDVYSPCAYTAKVKKFCSMMKANGHEVYLYASEDNEADVTELVTCITKAQQAEYGHNGPEDYLKIDFNPQLPLWQTFNGNVIKEMGTRVQPQDFICLITGTPAQSIAEAFPANMSVEFGIGYSGTFAKYRVFESYAWQHYVYGMQNSDAFAFDTVIPNYFDTKDFPFEPVKDDYYLFIGRLTPKKGFQIAQEVCERLGKRLVVAGPGEFSGYGEYVGVVGPEKRAELMGKALAVFVPTQYIGPFEGVSVEANLCGTPVITTDWGSFVENVTGGFNGYRCRTLQDFMSAAENVKTLDYLAIYDWAHGKFSSDVVSKQYEQYFNRLNTLWGDGWYQLDS